MPFQHHLFRDESLGIWLQAQSKGKEQVNRTDNHTAWTWGCINYSVSSLLCSWRPMARADGNLRATAPMGRTVRTQACKTSLSSHTCSGAERFGQGSNPFTKEFCLVAVPCFCGKRLSAWGAPKTPDCKYLLVTGNHHHPSEDYQRLVYEWVRLQT